MNNLFRTHADSKSTGTALLVFEDKTIGKVYFSEGVPVSARHQNKEGQNAVTAMQNLILQSSVLHPNIDAVQSNSVLNPAQRSQAPAQAVTQPVQKMPDRATAIPVPATQTMASLSDLQREQIVDQLANYIGPVANILMNQHDPNKGISDTIAGFTKNIHDPAEAKLFISTVEQILRNRA